MTPKKAPDLYTQLSEELDISESLIEKIVEFSYKDLRENLSGLKHPRVNVLGLGHFIARRKKVEIMMERYTKNLSNHSTSTMKAYHNKKTLEEKLDKLKVLHKIILEEEARKNEIKNGKAK